MKKLIVRTLIVASVLGLLVALILFGMNAASRLARSRPDHGAIPPPPLHSAVGNSDASVLGAPPEGNARPDVIGSVGGPTLPHAAAQGETESVQFVERTTPAD